MPNNFAKIEMKHRIWIQNQIRYPNISEFEIIFPLYDYEIEKQTMQIMDQNSPKHDKQCNSLGFVNKSGK